jgi:hypothetical protein
MRYGGVTESEGPQVRDYGVYLLVRLESSTELS